MTDMTDRCNRMVPEFPRGVGFRFVVATQERLVAEVMVREDTSNGAGSMHGGALMTVADTMGAIATILNLPADFRTTTLESKTNFIGVAPIGETITAECTPLHRGRTTQVWTTRLARADGRLVAVVTQTQIVLPRA